jgi:hypothetical protein
MAQILPAAVRESVRARHRQYDEQVAVQDLSTVDANHSKPAKTSPPVARQYLPKSWRTSGVDEHT